MERDRGGHIERKRQRGELEGNTQSGRDREERYRRRDIGGETYKRWRDRD